MDSILISNSLKDFNGNDGGRYIQPIIVLYLELSFFLPVDFNKLHVDLKDGGFITIYQQHLKLTRNFQKLAVHLTKGQSHDCRFAVK